MGRRKIIRSDEEEAEFQRLRRERNAQYKRNQRRQLSVNCINLNLTCSSASLLSTSAHSSHNVPVTDHEVRHEANIAELIGVSSIALNTNSSRSNVAVTVNEVNMNCNVISRQQRNQRYRQRNLISIRDWFDITNINGINEHYIGEMNILCVHCNAKHFATERIDKKGNSFNDCCNHGKVSLHKPPITNELYSLFNNDHPKSKHFHDRIRAYNASFSFASFNANLINFRSRRPGPYCFKIQGQIYYQINTSLYPETNNSPSYGQLFIVDPNEATANRLTNNTELDRDILEIIDKSIRENNIFAQSLQMMHEEVKKQQQLASENNFHTPEMQLLFTLRPGMDRRRFNFQQVNEVAAIFTTTANGEIPESYVSIRNRNTKALQQVSTMDPNVEPWVYPLFYPYGTQGWHRNMMRINDTKRISRSAYIKYHISIRDAFNVFLHGGRLFQQWIVDNYVKVEKDRITYCNEHQAQLRIDSYQGLHDYLQNRTHNTHNNRIGKIIVLPSSFIGSPRNMLQNYQDAMAIVRKHGKPDLFITMTCNPNWKEIQDNLFPGQCASDRPDLCARVFHLKKSYLLDLIVKQKCFGDVAAYVYTIEFQKRGLPHIHLLITLKPNSKIRTASIVDNYISAEIPDPEVNPTLHEIVMKNMLHGPCGNWCLINNKCSKHFPKPFHEETTLNEDGYPLYRRRNNDRTFFRRDESVVDNRYVVPYCPMLTMLFNCHINVEVVSSIKSVKYLYKYVYKGHDSAAVTISETNPNESVIDHDEIKDYVETRYVSPIEGVWRILGKPLQDKSHSIVRLPVHLPNQQNIVIDTEMNEDQMHNLLIDQTTMLSAYFQLNVTDEHAKQHFYSEIPTEYTFKKEKIDGRNIGRWAKRHSHFNSIGRMYSVSPTQVELFHLRLLLLTVKGATSFEALRTVDGIIHPTFSAACVALGLVDDDAEWQRSMHEAEVWMMPRSLRRLFVRILIHCHPLHPEVLWEDFKEAMSEDYIKSFGLSQGIRKAYLQIYSMLNAEGHTLAEFPQMEQIENINEVDNDALCTDEMMRRGLEQYDKLNEKQKEIVDVILNIVNDIEDNHTENHCFYIDGPGGSGKTFVYTTLWYMLKGQNKQVSTMAYTGIAATLLPQGKTVHKTFGLPVPLFADSSSNIKLQSKEAQHLLETDVFIWDEALMAPRYALEVMYRTLRDITNKNDVLFGGKIVLIGGDFRQLLPIQIHGTRNETINLSIKFSPLWKYFRVISLSQNMRVLPDEIEFSQFLLNLGDGVLNDEEDNIEMPSHYLAADDVDIVEDTFGELFKLNQFQEAAKCAILSARNKDVDEINNRVVELLDRSTERIYTSVDSANNCDDNGAMNEALLPEYLNSLSPSTLPPHELRLRIHTVVMLIRNLSIHEGLCNGTRLLILELGNNLLRCQILTGDKTGEIVFLNRITLYCENVYPFSFKRRQFPIKLAFAMTINKSQGQTFEKIGIDLRQDVFSHGHLYVACSRVRSHDSLKVFLGHQRTNRIIKNHIYKELYA